MFSTKGYLPISASVSVPAENHSNTLGILGKRTIETTPEKKGLLVFLGEKSVGQQTLNIIGQNICRAITGKPLYDLLFLKKDTRDDFQEKKMEYIYPDINKEHLKSSDQDVAVTAAAHIVITEMNVLLPENLTPGDYRKIYIPGIGLSGLPVLQCGDEMLSPSNIVNRLHENNLHKIKDIRLTSCHSADIYANKDFSPEEIKKALTPNSGWLARAIFGEQCSLATKVYKEFECRGIDVSVSGYNGKGVFYVREHGKPTTHLRSTTVPATPDHTVRRSDFRVSLGRTQPTDID